MHKPDLKSIAGAFCFNYNESNRTEAGPIEKGASLLWEVIELESCCEMRGPPINVQVCCSNQASAAQQSSTCQFPPLLLSFVAFLLPCMVSFLFYCTHSLLCFLSSSPQLRPREGWTQMSDRPGSRYKVEGLVLETWACQGGKWPLELEGVLRPMKPFKGLY